VLRHLLAPLFVAVSAAGWLAVQRAWMRTFPDESPDADALSGRLGCHGGDRCDKQCERTSGRRCRTVQEDRT
jgi:hypothetical protein